MKIRLIQVPYDSGHRAQRMGCGPLHLIRAGAPARLGRLAQTSLVSLETSAPFATEIGSAFELHRAVAATVSDALREGALPFVLSGNCNASLGTVAGVQDAQAGDRLGVLWFDGHGDSNTPETFTGSFLDAMGLSTLTGRCWQALAGTVPGFRPLPDEHVLLVGAHGADPAALSVLNASRIGLASTAELHSSSPSRVLGPALDRLSRQGVTRLYLHLDVDVLDARYAMANQFARDGGLLPDQLAQCVDTVLARFEAVAAGVASYDPAFDKQGFVSEAAIQFLEAVARARGVA
jgi:arginase